MLETTKTKEKSKHEADIRKTAAKVKEFCLSRINEHKEACRDCPIKDICFNPPYLWEV